MKSISPLHRFLVWFSPDHLTAFGMVFFGAHTFASWCLADHFQAHSAFATILPTSPGRHVETLVFIAGPLLIGGVLQACGLRWRKPRAVIFGGLLGFFVFSSALASSCVGNPLGTGVGAYVIIVLLYLVFSLCRSVRIEWIPVSAA